MYSLLLSTNSLAPSFEDNFATIAEAFHAAHDNACKNAIGFYYHWVNNEEPLQIMEKIPTYHVEHAKDGGLFADLYACPDTIDANQTYVALMCGVYSPEQDGETYSSGKYTHIYLVKKVGV